MGLRLVTKGRTAWNATAWEEERTRQLYTTYFPRLFAYVLSCLGDDRGAAEEMTAEVFERALRRRSSDGDERAFRLALFSTAHRLCWPVLKKGRPGDPLEAREREIIALTFDAQLPPGEIATILRASRGSVTGALMSGLRKLRDQTPPAVLAAYLRASEPRHAST